MFKQLTIAACAAAALFAGAAGNAQLGVDLGLGADVGVRIKVGDPYTYDGYRSDRWYYDDDPYYRARWYEDYGGYDCTRGYYYTWHERRRARYQSYWCYNEGGRRFREVRRTRVVVYID